MRSLAFIAAVVLSLATPAAAQSETTTVSGEDWLTMRVWIRAGEKPEALRKRMVSLFSNSTWTGEAVTARDHEIAVMAQRARLVAGEIAQRLAYDFDGDGQLTRAELELALAKEARRMLRSGGVMLKPTEEQVRQILDQRIALVMAGDEDRDGVLSYDEMRKAATAKLSAYRRHSVQNLVPLSMDSDGDGKVSQAEFEAAVDRVIARADADGDGEISQAEMLAWRIRVDEARRRIAAAERALRKP